MGESDEIKQCKRDENGQISWQDYTHAKSSMNPFVNPPNKQCSAVKVGEDQQWNTDDTNTDNETCVDNIPLDRWFHLTLVTHSQSADIYIDGKLVNTITFNSAPVIYNDAPLVLCKDSKNTISGLTKHGFSGALTQVRYFKQALNPYDVLRIYSWGPHPFELADPETLKNEIKGLGGSMQVTSSMSQKHDDEMEYDYNYQGY